MDVTEEKITLNKPNVGLLINTNIWRELDNFSSGAVCLVITSAILTSRIILETTKSFLTIVKLLIACKAVSF
jgi:hypothetical protein